jgi:uncharacterized protein
MYILSGNLVHSASDLNTFLACSHAVALNLQKLRDPASLPDKAEDDEANVLIQDAGLAHEAAYLNQLKSETAVVEIPSTGVLGERVEKTIAAMTAGIPVITQGAFQSAPWHGYADFLRRVEMPSALGNWSYETIDTKLARTADPKHVLQIALYSELIADVQKVMPHQMHLKLGDGRQETFRTVEFRHTLTTAKKRYLDFVGEGAPQSRPEPNGHCGFCGWREYCAEQWEREDHLSRIAGINKSQIKKLCDAGINSIAELAKLPPGTKVHKLAPTSLERIRAQASLQVARRLGEPAVEYLPIEPGRGFARLPKPDPADLFFDLEGDPLYPDGLEYLWGVHYSEDGEARFRFEWGHDRAAERAAFERTVDFFIAHLTAHPNAHIYHYAPYEVTVLRRLSTAFASREEAVDWLLRSEKLVDLYAVVRQAVRTSEPDLSLKTLEVFFAEKRGEDVKKADQSIVHYHRWRETGDQALLDGILAYNKVDCENTEGLRDWIVRLRPDLPWWIKPGEEPAPEKTEEILAEEARREALRKAVRSGATHLSERGRELIAHLVDFHARAKKPEQWAVFDRCARDVDELIDDGECIGDIMPDGSNWQRREKASIVARYRFPEQDTKLKEGSTVLHAPTRGKLGTVLSFDRRAHVIELKRTAKNASPWPEAGAIIPGWPIDTEVLETAVGCVAKAWANGEADRYCAIADLIERRSPGLLGWSGGDLVRPGESLIDAATGRALALDESLLFIQGPPGTGKTYTSAHVILSLIAAGKKVGVSSNSHKAINNLLAKVEEVAEQRGITFTGAKKSSPKDPDSFLNGRMIEDICSNEDIEDGAFDLVGGTAWLFARFDQAFDYLFVDEAGQVSLGHLVAMGVAAKNIILVGDQMQLGQPIQGAHPGESGMSVLDYLLEGAATIASDRGILLDTSWRMNPAIERFISDAVYDGRLKAHPDCARQTLVLDGRADPDLRPFGIRVIAMDHEGCSQRSDEEVEKVAALYASLIGQGFVDRHGDTGVIGPDNILIVAPYNMQVNALKARLPEEARIGTVDKFQGLEAEVVIVSLVTSTPDDLPRHVDFFYSKNRLNVAISRARTLAVVLANPKLLELHANTVEHLRLVNTLAWLSTRSE